jgi:aldehyde dehydrogenase (NAD+)
VAQVEIFGPVLVAMTFRTPAEAVQLANNTVYGLASSLWTQNLDVAHDIAAKIKAGTVWINCTNQFDASAGFGGYRESGYGREGGREGLFEYLKPKLVTVKPTIKPTVKPTERTTALDKTHKLYIGGKQARPDSGYSLAYETTGGLVEVGRGNRKDIRNAVEAADSAFTSWSGATAFNRSQVLYYFAENFEGAKSQIINSLSTMGQSTQDANEEFELSLDRILHYAAMADKYEAETHQVPQRSLIYTRKEAIGPVAVIAPDSMPLLGWLSACLPLIAMGNSVIGIPSYSNPLPALELYRVIEASDVPAGVWNVITGTSEELEKTLADHDGIMAIWHFGTKENGEMVQRASAGNLKQTWCLMGKSLDWTVTPSPEFLRRATQIKNVWVPYGA